MNGEAKRSRVEIVHESLLAQWPRLVRWRAQDVEGAQLRDELRQAAQMWDQHGRAEDFLWTGTAFREYALWREHYPGGLTELEEEFGRAMTAAAGRHRRRRRALLAAAISIIAAVALALGVLWQRSTSEARRATAAKLLALGQASLDEDRTAALAYATESLRLADTEEARRFAVEVLWNGPTAMVSPEGPGVPWPLHFSPDGSWLAVGYWSGDVRVYPRDGTPPRVLEGFSGNTISYCFFDEHRPRAAALAFGGRELRIFSLPSWRQTDAVDVGQAPVFASRFAPDGDLVVFEGDPRAIISNESRVTAWRWGGNGTSRRLGAFRTHTGPLTDTTLSRIVYGVGNQILMLPLDRLDSAPVVVGTHDDIFKLNNAPAIDRQGRFVAAHDEGGNLVLWSLEQPGRALSRRVSPPSPGTIATVLSDDGSLLCIARVLEANVWEIEGVTGADPIRLPSVGGTQLSGCDFDPRNRWAATLRGSRISLWQLHEKRVRTLRGHASGPSRVAFSPDSRYLYSLGSQDGVVMRWPLYGRVDESQTVVHGQPKAWGWGLSLDPANRFLISTTVDATWLVPLDGTAARKLPRPRSSIPGAAIDPSGRRIADSVFYNGPLEELTVIELESGERVELGSEAEGKVEAWNFDAWGRLVVVRGGKLQVIDLSTRMPRTIVESGAWGLAFSPDRRRAVTEVDGKAALVDFQSGEVEPLAWDLTVRRPEVNERNLLPGCALGPHGTVVEVLPDGTLRVGRLDGGEPHLLYGHDTIVNQITISPDGRWIAGAGLAAVYLWPMPDLDRPPLHTLPRKQLIARLESLSNVRALVDAASPTGYTITIDDAAYKGWKESSEW